MAENADLHVFFLPFLGPGHMIPMVDLAKLMAARPGVRATVVTTAANAPLVEPAIARSPRPIALLTLPYPDSVPDNVRKLPTPDLPAEFIDAINTLKDPLDRLVAEHKPDCLVSGVFYPWTAYLASDHGIPRLAFHGTSAITMALMSKIRALNLDELEANFVFPGVPHRIEMVKSQLPRATTPDTVIMEMIKAHEKTYGTVMNTFADLEAGYTESLRGRTWLVGPVSLCNRDAEESAVRGGEESRNLAACMEWLDGKSPGSVLYACFGSLGKLTRAQLREVAAGLADAGRPFLWVIRDAGDTHEWMPDGFEEKGLIVRGWAPQVAILGHAAVGGFLTHCGWNSCLEGVTAGVPMVTWPQFAEQFLNEKLVVDVLGVGVPVGAKVCSGAEEERTLVERDVVARVVKEVMGSGAEAGERRGRAKELAEKARAAMAPEGGSSYVDMTKLIEELREMKSNRARGTESS